MSVAVVELAGGESATNEAIPSSFLIINIRELKVEISNW